MFYQSKRHFIALAAGLASIAAFSTIPLAMAQQVDSLKVLVPANAGGGWDQTGRQLEAAMKSTSLIKSSQIQNVGGAAGTIGLAQFVNTNKGDGSAVLIGGMVMVGGIHLNKSPVNLSMVTPIAKLTSEYEAIVVPAASDIKTLADLIAKFKANPGSVSWAGGSAGGTDHILVGLIAKEAGVDPSKMNYVAYAGGGEATAALLGNQVTAGVSGWAEFAQHIRSGKMRVLAVSSDKRMEGIDVPTLKEQGVNVVLANWRGIFGAPGISGAQRDSLVKLVGATVKSDAWKATLKKNEWGDSYLAGDDFAKFIDDDTKRITAILDSLNLKKKS
jgi:putative tricarboxylic transport membrane protein